ncbi:hypothetical protein [Halopseudomonas salegens]|uniref:Uncharacterized protein n=1 Tax=Halopseudomonas salegens TaxID=1434072 RepID=A0A1H2HTT6_9GAMM|nr:hypothetical protein [Halopseudomonas salegens]SDU35320.1 hypothetical protein SAMN05216210_3308 [Halopseudomonas salegens]
MLLRVFWVSLSLGLIFFCAAQQLVIKDLNEALNQQGINTSHVEIVMRNMHPDITYKELKDNMVSSFGEGLVTTYEINSSGMWLEGVDDALFLNGTVFYFKDGVFYGTRLEKGSSLKDIVLDLFIENN